jgi:3,4-dihydroxy-2-butanone 4-phosphate synthase
LATTERDTIWTSSPLYQYDTEIRQLTEPGSFFKEPKRAKSTAATERSGHGGATHQTANLCSKTNCAAESMVPDIDPE